jgi:GntR family transcriptional regulator
LAIRIDTSDPRPIYVQIMDEVRRGIVIGTWREGEMLPSARQVALDLRVNPNTVQQAYRELEREGTVDARRGEGTFVSGEAVARESQERTRMADAVADRALREAYRHGLSPEELLDAINRSVGAGARAAGAGSS